VTQNLSSAALQNLQRLLGLAGGDATQNTTLEDSAVQLVQDVGNLAVSALPGLADNSTFYLHRNVIVSGAGQTVFNILDPYNPELLGGVTRQLLKDFDIWILGFSATSVDPVVADDIALASVSLAVNSDTSFISGSAAGLEPVPLATWTKLVQTGGSVNPPIDSDPSFVRLRFKMPRNTDGLGFQITTLTAAATVAFKGWCELVAPGGRPSAF